jgi:glutaredoxin
MNSTIIELNKKIINNQNYFIIFSLSFCNYSKKTKEYLKNKQLKYKNYVVNKYYNNFFTLLKKLSKSNPLLNINLNHKTFPIIFYNNKFIGGYDDLIKFI